MITFWPSILKMSSIHRTSRYSEPKTRRHHRRNESPLTQALEDGELRRQRCRRGDTDDDSQEKELNGENKKDDLTEREEKLARLESNIAERESNIAGREAKVERFEAQFAM